MSPSQLYHMLIKVYSESACSDRVCDWYLKFYTDCILSNIQTL